MMATEGWECQHTREDEFWAQGMEREQKQAGKFSWKKKASGGALEEERKAKGRIALYGSIFMNMNGSPETRAY